MRIRPEECLLRAKDADEEAVRSVDPDVRKSWVHVAASYRLLADETQRLDRRLLGKPN